MAVVLLRHTTPDVAPGICYGASDLALAGSFEQEAEAVLLGLPDVPCVISSPLSRCLRLASLIAARKNREVIIANHWREMDFGKWEGTAWADIPRSELDAWAADFHHFNGHGGESVASLSARVRTGLYAAPDGALVVTHAGVIKAALAHRGRPGAWDHQTPFGGMVRV